MTFKEIIGDIADVVRQVIGASAVSPSVKADLHDKLTDVVAKAGAVEQDMATAAQDEAKALPAEAGGAAEVVVEKIGSLAGPIGGAVADMAAPVAGAEAAQVAGQFLSVIQAHNKSLESDLGAIIAKLNPPK